MTFLRSLSLLAVAWMALLLGAPSAALATANTSTPFTIRWTAPGDDGSIGRATAYELRYSNVLITAANYASAAKLTGLPLPGVAGTPETFVVTGMTDGAQVFLAIKARDEAGNWAAISNIMKRPGYSTGADSPVVLAFSSSWPNPARESVHWSYSMPQPAMADVQVYDAMGRRVRTVVRGERPAGAGELAWDLRDEGGRTVAAGTYFVKARLGASEWTKRVVVAR